MKILFAADGSEHAQSALQVILQRSWQEGVIVKLISVVEPLHPKLEVAFDKFKFGLGALALDAQKSVRETITAKANEFGAALKEKFGERSVTVEVLEGRDKDKIIEECKNYAPDLLIIGAHGLPDAPIAAGSVTDAVISHARSSIEILKIASPAIMVKELENQQPIEEDKYLIALDDSECSQKTLKHILERAWGQNAKFTIISVVEPLPFEMYQRIGPWEGFSNYGELIEQTRAAQLEIADKLVAEAAAALKAKFPQAEVQAEILEGSARDQILAKAASWPADLIIMGSHGRRGVTEFVLGSVSKSVTTASPCSVLIVRS